MVVLAAGPRHSVACRRDGRVLATSNKEANECDVRDWHDIVAVAAGSPDPTRPGVVRVGASGQDPPDRSARSVFPPQTTTATRSSASGW